VKRRLTVVLVVLLMLLPLSAKEKKIPFDAQAALSYLKDLASDAQVILPPRLSLSATVFMLQRKAMMIMLE